MRKSAYIIGFATVLALVLVMLCSPAQAGSSFIQDSIDDGSLVLYHDYRAGHTQDLSGQGNDGTNTGYWSGKGLQFGNSDEVTVTDGGAATELQLTAGTLVLLGDFRGHAAAGNERLIIKRDAGGTNWEWYIDTGGNMLLYDGTNWRTIACNVTGARYVATNFSDGTIAEAFVDGVSIGNYNVASSISVDDADVMIGNYHTGGSELQSTLHAALIFNDKLTATEHAKLYAELTSLTWPKKGGGTAQGTYGAELVTDGDMEAATTAAYAAGNSATLTKEDDRVLGGEQVLRIARNGVDHPYARQACLTVGKKYRTKGWARGDGTAYPRVWANSGAVDWTGTNSTTWQYFDITIDSATSANILLQGVTTAGVEWVEYDNVTVTEVSADHTQFKSDWNAKITSNVTANYVGDTPIYASSGAYKVEVQTVKGLDSKVIECTNTGDTIVYGQYFQGDSTQDAYGTWEFTFSKDDASTAFISFIMDSGGTTGYFIALGANEAIALYEAPATCHFSTVAAYFSADTWYTLKITRRQSDGMFTVYLDDIEVDESGGSGSNPIADNTTTTSDLMGWSYNAGDKICLGSKDGQNAIVKKHGVQ